MLEARSCKQGAEVREEWGEMGKQMHRCIIKTTIVHTKKNTMYKNMQHVTNYRTLPLFSSIPKCMHSSK